MEMIFIIQMIVSAVVFNTCFTQTEEMDLNVSISLDHFKALRRRVDTMEQKQASTEADINQLNSYVGSVGALMTRHFKVESALDETQNELRSTTRDHDNDVADLRNEMQGMKQNVEIVIRDLRQTNHDNDIIELRNKMQEIQHNHADITLELLRRNYDNVITELRSEMRAIKENHDNVITELRSEMRDIKENHYNVIAELRSKMRDIKENHENVTTELRSEMRDIKKRHDNVTTELRSEMRDIKENHDRVITELRSEMRDIKENHGKVITEFRSEIWSIKENHENVTTELRSEMRDIKETLSTGLRNEMAEMKESHESIVVEIRKDLQEMKQDRNSLRNQIQIINKDRYELQNKTLSLKQDVDEILLKMQEEQNGSRCHQVNVDSPTQQDLMQAIYKCIANITDFKTEDITTASTTMMSTPSTTEVTTNIATTPTTTASGVSGKKFLLAFIKNCRCDGDRYLQCLITTDVSGMLTVQVPFLNIYEHKTLQVGQNVFNLTETLQANNMVIENKSVYIETTVNVNVYAMNIEYGTSDGFYVIPLNRLSTEYCIATSEVPSSAYKSEVLVVATENNTSVRFKFNTIGNILYKGHTYNNTRDLLLSLNKYETFQVVHDHDLTGTFIIATEPVAVVSGNNVGVGHGHISEMMPPVTSLGQKYIIPAFKPSYFINRQIRVIIARNDTYINYTISGQMYDVFLKQSNYINETLANYDTMFLSSTKPVLVSASVDTSRLNDQFMLTVIGIERYLKRYTVAVESAGFTSYASIVILSSSVSGLYLDGNPVNTTCTMTVTAFSNNQYCLMVIPLPSGYHTMHHEANKSFGLYVYGWRYSDAYGYFAGMKF